MKAQLVPLYFDPGRDEDFDKMLAVLRVLLAEHAEFLEPVPLGGRIPEADGVIFPQLLGEAYRQAAAFRDIHLPILLVTSEFGTLSMWDWEIAEYLRSSGVPTIGPYNVEQTKKVCAAPISPPSRGRTGTSAACLPPSMNLAPRTIPS